MNSSNIFKVHKMVTAKPLLVRFTSQIKEPVKPTTTKDPVFPVTVPPAETEKPPVKSDDSKLLNQLGIVSPAPDIRIKETIEPPADIEVLKRSLSFDEVPGPTALRNISKVWSYIPAIGTQVTASTIQYLLSAGQLFGTQLSWGRNMFLFRWLLDKYGPVVRLHGPLGGDVVIISRPEHAYSIFQNDGRYPVRSSLDCIEKYRLQYRKYNQAGPFLMYGPEWEKLRSVIQAPLQNSVTMYYNKISSICEELVTRIERIRNFQDEVPENFLEEINKWSLECLCSVTLNKQLGFLGATVAMDPLTEPAQLLEALQGATKDIRRCESGLHLWKFVKTPAWMSLVKNCDTIDTILNKHIVEAQVTLREKKDTPSIAKDDKIPLLEVLLLNQGMTAQDVLTVLLDLMIIGVNATTHCASFLMYHLARNPRVQRKLTDEIVKQPTQLSSEKLKSMTYLQACIKESLRLKPPIPILSRVLTKDVIIHNYRVPKGTYMLIATHLSTLREEYFEDAHRFNPDRWLSPESASDNLFASIPFGHGPKACLARDLAEMQIGLLFIKLLKKFTIEYHYGDINTTNRLLAQPDRPLKFRFIERI